MVFYWGYIYILITLYKPTAPKTTTSKYNPKSGKNEVVYDLVSQVVDEALIVQKKCIWDSAQDEQKADPKNIKLLYEWGNDINQENKKNDNFKFNSDGKILLRQDEIEDGIKPILSGNDLFLIGAEMADYNSEKTDYDLFFEHNVRIALTRYLTFAHLNNGQFQQDMEDIFYDDENAKYANAPVKTYDRCQIKSTTDYANEPFPSCASILDYLRCSVTYPDSKTLLAGLNNFVELIENDEIYCIRKPVLRVKNGYSNIVNWKSLDDAHYCDIKLNLWYVNPKTNESMIVEVQFLLKFLLKAKKLGHKWYGISRRKPYVDSVSNISYNIDANYEKYKAKVLSLVIENNLSQFSKEILLKPNIMINIIEKCAFYGQTIAPLLYHIGRNKNSKMFELFLDCLYHFGNVILDDTNNKNSKTDEKEKEKEKGKEIVKSGATFQFFEKYFNNQKCNQAMIGYTTFWGIDANGGDKNLKLIEKIMKAPYFHGLNQKEGHIQWMMSSIAKNEKYIKLLIQCCHKNIIWLAKEVFYSVKRKQNCDAFFKICKESPLEMTQETYDQVMQICAKDEVMKEFQSIVEKQYKKMA